MSIQLVYLFRVYLVRVGEGLARFLSSVVGQVRPVRFYGLYYEVLRREVVQQGKLSEENVSLVAQVNFYILHVVQ